MHGDTKQDGMECGGGLSNTRNVESGRECPMDTTVLVAQLVPIFSKLKYMERLIPVELHVGHQWHDNLWEKLHNLQNVPVPHSAAHKALLQQVEGMIDLLYGYVRTLFIIGCHARDCHSGPSTCSNESTMLYSRWLHGLICV